MYPVRLHYNDLICSKHSKQEKFVFNQSRPHSTWTTTDMHHTCQVRTFPKLKDFRVERYVLTGLRPHMNAFRRATSMQGYKQYPLPEDVESGTHQLS